MRLLVTGAGGLVGGRLAALLARDFDVVAARHRAEPPPALPTADLDILRTASVRAALDGARPDAVIHAAGLADPDQCEERPHEAEEVNVGGSRALSRECRRRGIRLVLLSTDLVFPGSGGPWRETDTPAPVLVYGRTKLRAEEAVMGDVPDAIVLRLALVCGRGHGVRATVSEAIAWALRARRSLRLFTDQYRTPVSADSIAAAVRAALGRGPGGLYHLGGAERISRHALGLRVARVLGLPADGVEPVTQAATPARVPRPADVSLDSARARSELGWRPCGLDEAIRDGRAAPDIIPPAR